MAASRMEMLASAKQVASGNSAAFPVPTLTMAAIGVDVTAVEGTSPQLDLWLEGSTDGGTTWFELVADQVLKSSGVAAANTVSANARDIVEAKTSTDAEKFIGVYKHLPVDTVRVHWTISGTSPGFTFAVDLVGK